MISGLDTVLQSPGAGLLAIFLVMLPIVIFIFFLINVFIYRTKDKQKVLYLFMAAQPISSSSLSYSIKYWKFLSFDLTILDREFVGLV